MLDRRASHSRRILVIDDNDAIHADFKKTLAAAVAPSAKLASAKAALFGDAPRKTSANLPRFELDSAAQGEEGVSKAEAALREGKPYNVAFVDMRMPPGMDGVQTIQRLWETDPNVQVVICTAYSDYSWEELSQKLGLTDKLLLLKKPFDPAEVSQLAAALSEKWALHGEVTLKTSELELRVAERTAELLHAAQHDKLTGLPNRALLRERLTKAIERRRADPNYNFAVLFLDFDRFKIVNDSFGHEVGDELLMEISRRLSQSLRAGDAITSAGASDASTAARLGGDEFVLLVDELKSDNDAVVVAERLLNVLRLPYNLKGHTVFSSASVGITTSQGGYERAEDMIRDADTAMYRAKNTGKGRCIMFDLRMHDEVMAQMQMEADLRQVVERNELVLHYQPIISLESGALCSIEALVRWNHPSRGLVQPNDFIGCCEETGMIIPVGYWVLTESCRQLRLWQDRYPWLANLSVNINLSARQLCAPDLVARVAQILHDQRVNPASVVLEITETAMIRTVDDSLTILQKLKALGVRLNMDDFGVGYSSLSCLHRLPLDGLKIDKSFVSCLSERRDYAAVVQAIVTLAQNLGITLTAEGIETADQLVMLQSMGCDNAQGFYFSRPMTAIVAEAYILEKGQKAA